MFCAQILDFVVGFARKRLEARWRVGPAHYPGSAGLPRVGGGVTMAADRDDGVERLVMAARGGRCGLRMVLEGLSNGWLAGITGLVSKLGFCANRRSSR